MTILEQNEKATTPNTRVRPRPSDWNKTGTDTLVVVFVCDTVPAVAVKARIPPDTLALALARCAEVAGAVAAAWWVTAIG